MACPGTGRAPIGEPARPRCRKPLPDSRPGRHPRRDEIPRRAGERPARARRRRGSVRGQPRRRARAPAAVRRPEWRRSRRRDRARRRRRGGESPPRRGAAGRSLRRPSKAGVIREAPMLLVGEPQALAQALGVLGRHRPRGRPGAPTAPCPAAAARAKRPVLREAAENRHEEAVLRQQGDGVDGPRSAEESSAPRSAPAPARAAQCPPAPGRRRRGPRRREARRQSQRRNGRSAGCAGSPRGCGSPGRR